MNGLFFEKPTDEKCENAESVCRCDIGDIQKMRICRFL